MDTLPPAIRKLAEQLLTASRVADDRSTERDDVDSHIAQRLCEILRVSLTRFVGADGFSALLRRAIALAARDVPALNSIKLGSDCRIDGFENLLSDGESDAAAVAIVGHLVLLLITFIGEPLTLQLLREVWPETPPNLQEHENRG